VKRVFDAGVPVVLGTDTGFFGVFLGVSTQIELELLVEAGLIAPEEPGLLVPSNTKLETLSGHNCSATRYRGSSKNVTKARQQRRLLSDQIYEREHRVNLFRPVQRL
jgi:hypothetical protein